MKRPFRLLLLAVLALVLTITASAKLTFNGNTGKFSNGLTPAGQYATQMFYDGVECYGPYTASPTTITSTVITPSATLGDTLSPVKVYFYANTQALLYDYQSNTTTGQGKGLPLAVSTTAESPWLSPGTPLRVQSQTATATMYYWLCRPK